MTKLPVSILRNTTLRAKDLSTATLQMRTNGQKWSVVRYLPAGMDIAPDQFTWRSLDDAKRNYESQLDYIKEKGFTIETDTH